MQNACFGNLVHSRQNCSTGYLYYFQPIIWTDFFEFISWV
jgi:hypothetical protein